MQLRELGKINLDLDNCPKPKGVPDEMWARPDMRPIVIEEYPHSKSLIALPCAGIESKVVAGHKYHLIFSSPEWVPAKRRDSKGNTLPFGCWEFRTQDFGWFDQDNIPSSELIDGRQFTVEVFESDPDTTSDLCPSCLSTYMQQ